MPSFERNFIRFPIPLSGFLSGLLLGITLQFSPDLFGDELAASQVPQTETLEPQPAPETPPPVLLTPETAPQTATSDIYDSWDVSRDYLSGKITSFASYIDRFFGGDRHFQESNDSVLQIDLSKLNGYGSDHKIDLAARMNLRLPITEGRLHLLIETDPENNINATPTPGSTAIKNNVNVPKSVAVATRYAAAKEDVWHFSTDVGVKFPIPPKPFVRSRGSYSIPLGRLWRLKAEESVYWFNTLGAGETSQLDFERIISPPLLFRSSSIVTWLNDTQNFDMRQDLSVFHTLTDRSALLYQASAIGISNPQYQMTDFVLLMLYRYRMHQEWLYFEISPQLHFPRDRQYQYSPALSMRLEILFDDSR
jgi:hypothetical protein